jgi:hypothetical protein
MASLSDEEFDELFTTFEHTAFRLESRDSYAGVVYGVPAFERWMAGELVPPDTRRPWYRNVHKQTASGKRFTRVRVVSEPWSDYTQYALWSVPANIEAGEDIRYLPRSQAQDLGLPIALPGYDYWLFDSRLVVVLRFDDNTNDILSHEVIDDPAAVIQHNYWRDAAWHYAIQCDEYVRQVGEPVEPPSPASR